MNIKHQLSVCLKQTAQMEQEAQSLDLTPSEQVRLAALLQSAKEALAEAEKMIPQREGDGLKETATKLRLWERKLLDLSLRNNLLNMKLGKNAIRYEHDDIATLEDELDQGKEFVLEQKELKGIYRAVRNNLEESGVNTLFLTLGTLNWNERAGGRQYAAPILLVPVEIVPMKKGAYAIRERDEEVMLNITLMEMLKQQFDIDVEGVNPLPKDAHGIDVSLVLHLVREAVKEQTEWEVVEDSVLGIFSFSKFVMWNDIHSHGAAVMESPIISSLVEGRLMMEDEGAPIDARQLDAAMRPEEMAIPVDTDSSQLEAIAESEQGRSFILFGPPGTGKSQTITNLIANALYHQKRVLFVAEKKAALDVVQSRLDKIGLAPFCLELHSNKVDKQHFLRQMQQAIDAVGAEAPEGFQRVADQLFQQRLQLIQYIDALHQKQTDSTSL
jgi:flagellar biosynthesis GTPase FlhF